MALGQPSEGQCLRSLGAQGGPRAALLRNPRIIGGRAGEAEREGTGHDHGARASGSGGSGGEGGASDVGADVAVAVEAGADADADGDAEADAEAGGEAEGVAGPEAWGERSVEPDAEERGAVTNVGARSDAAAAARGGTTGLATTLGPDEGAVVSGGLSVGITGRGTAAGSRPAHAAMVLGRAATTTSPMTAATTTAPTIHARIPAACAGFSSVAAHGDAV